MLEEYAESEALLREREYWLQLAGRESEALPVDNANGSNKESDADRVTAVLTADETQALLQTVPPVYRTQINDALLTVLVQTTASWTGTKSLMVTMEGHGRAKLIFEDADTSRTVGWFTSMYPAELNIEHAQGIGEAMKIVKEQLRSIPNKGIGYGILGYVSADRKNAQLLQSINKAEISFNYMGQFGMEDAAEPEFFAPSPESSGLNLDEDTIRQHRLDVSAVIAGGQLSVHWTYSREQYSPNTIQMLADRYMQVLREMIDHCRDARAEHYMKDDFEEFGWDQEQLDDILGMIKNISE